MVSAKDMEGASLRGMEEGEVGEEDEVEVPVEQFKIKMKVHLVEVQVRMEHLRFWKERVYQRGKQTTNFCVCGG